MGLNDERFEIRARAMVMIGRLSVRNPAYVMPSLRKVLIQVGIITWVEGKQPVLTVRAKFKPHNFHSTWYRLVCMDSGGPWIAFDIGLTSAKDGKPAEDRPI